MLKIKELPDFLRDFQPSQDMSRAAEENTIYNQSCLVSRVSRFECASMARNINYDGAKSLRLELTGAVRDAMMLRRDHLMAARDKKDDLHLLARALFVDNLARRALAAYLRVQKLIMLYNVLGRAAKSDKIVLPGLQEDNHYWLDREEIE